MSKNGLREAYKKLAQMYEEDKVKVEELDRQQGDAFDEYEDFYDDRIFDEYGKPYNKNGNYARDISLDFPEELEANNSVFKYILEKAKKHSRDYTEQVKFVINAIEANRVWVIVSGGTIFDILEPFSNTSSKLGKLLDKHTIIPVGYEDIDSGTLGNLFRSAGKTIDELPEQVLTDSSFMHEYLTSDESVDKDFLNGSFMDCPELTIKDIINKVTSICNEEVDR